MDASIETNIATRALCQAAKVPKWIYFDQFFV